jgi:hypothetical protein
MMLVVSWGSLRGEDCPRDRTASYRDGARPFCGGETSRRVLGCTARQSQPVPVLADPLQKLLSRKEQLLPNTPLDEAVNYALGQWTELNALCSDGCAHRQQHQ